MINPYVIILSAFGIAGIAVTLWGWTIITRARKTQRWPSVEGIIIHMYVLWRFPAA